MNLDFNKELAYNKSQMRLFILTKDYLVLQPSALLF